MIHSSVGEALTTTSTQVKGSWPPAISGNGFVVHGKIADLRYHTVQDAAKKYHRYMAVILDVEEVRNRVYQDGVEIEGSQYAAEKAQSKGYLNKYDHQQVDPTKIEVATFFQRLSSRPIPDGGHTDTHLHPNVKNRFEFWGDVNLIKPIGLKKGQDIKLKTQGDSTFIDSASPFLLERGNTQYSGENVLGGWTTKIQPKSDKPAPGSSMQGADDSEWD